MSENGRACRAPKAARRGRGGAAVVTAAATHRGVVPFIPSNPLVMTVVFTFPALATRLPPTRFRTCHLYGRGETGFTAPDGRLAARS